MKEWFLSIQATYAKAQVALFHNKKCIQEVTNQNVAASSHLIPLCQELLSQHKISLNDLQFIAIDKGPGAFTSLRVALATVNGIAFAHSVPLVGVNSLQALLGQMSREEGEGAGQRASLAVVLLNAYNNDVYYAVHGEDEAKIAMGVSCEGCCNIEHLLDEVAALSSQRIVFAGNAVAMHQQVIQTVLKDKKINIMSDLQLPTAHTIGLLGLALWEKDAPSTYWLDPYYLKTQYFAIRAS